MTLRRARLGVRSRTEFRATLRKGRSTLRIAFSVNQAGAGYLGCDEPGAQSDRQALIGVQRSIIRWFASL